MEAPSYSDPDGHGHACTDWQIVLQSTGQVVWSRNCTTASLREHIHLPDGTFGGPYAGRTELDYDTDYRLRVRFHDSAGEASAWAERAFRTLPAGPPGEPGAVPWTVEPGYEIEIVATGFAMPTNIAFVPDPGPQPSDPYFYVVELHGTIKVVKRDGTVSVYASNLLNFDPFDYPSSAQQGIGGIVVEPQTGDLFVSLLYQHTASTETPKPKYPKVIRLHSTNGGRTAASQTTVIDMFGDAQEYSHQIANLTIGPDGKLYVHNGDGITNSGKAQNLQSWGGKILRSNLNGTAPSDNPFYSAGDGITPKDYVWAYGFRNPFGGAWRASDSGHYSVENGPTVDRFAKIVAGRDYNWGDTSIDRDVAMETHAIYNWDPAHGPVNIAFVEPQTFAGSGFPASKHDHAFVTESGPTYGSGPMVKGKRIVEFVVGQNENLLSGPTTFAEYRGVGKASAAALAAGPDGLYFSDLYKDESSNPLEPGANILRIRHVGHSGGGEPPPAGTPPVNTSAPSVSGTPRVGETLTASPGGWSGTAPISYAYSWQRCTAGGGGGSYPAAIQADSPLAYWRFEETAGTVADDSAGSRNGVFRNSPALGAPGVAGSRAVGLDGIDDHVEVPGSVAPNPTGQLTVEAWIKSANPTWNTPGFAASKRKSYVLHPNSGSKAISFKLFIGSTEHSIAWTPPTDFDIRAWHHYVGTYDGTTQRLYVDGIQRASAPRTGALRNDTGALFLGRDDGFARYGKATLDEIAVYSTALTPARISTHHAQGTGGGGGGQTCVDIATGRSLQLSAADAGTTIRAVVRATNLYGQGVAQSALVGPVQASAGADPVILAAGDIADCAQSGDETTAALLDAHPQANVLTLGDNAYPSGTAAQFTNCYEPSWGRAKARTRPSPGNHDYETSGAAGYFGYFGTAAGDPSKGYYSFDLGRWHIVSLNSNCVAIGGCGAGSPQEQWLRSDLAANNADCTLAYWHHPRFSSGFHGNDPTTAAFWEALYADGADLILAGHEHSYERFAPQSPSAEHDPTFGIRQFVVGTGGVPLRGFGSALDTSQVRDSSALGVLKLVLHSSGYDWEFLAEAGKTFQDTGSENCSTSAPPPPPPPTGSPPSNTSLPSISGTAQVGQTLTASPGAWSGTAPIFYSYSWQRCTTGGGGPSYAEVVLADQPAAFWRFEDTGGTVAADSGGGSRNGIYRGGPTLGAVGIASSNAVTLDGVDDHVEVPGAVAPNPTNQLTVEAWIKSTTPTWNTPGFAVSKRKSYVLHPNSGSKSISFKVFVGTSEHTLLWTPPATFDIQAWHHYAATYDGASQRLFVDGVERASAPLTGALRNDTGALFLGRDDGFERYGKATLDEIAVYPTALSAARIAAHSQSGFGAPSGPASCTTITGAGSADLRGHRR